VLFMFFLRGGKVEDFDLSVKQKMKIADPAPPAPQGTQAYKDTNSNAGQRIDNVQVNSFAKYDRRLYVSQRAYHPYHRSFQEFAKVSSIKEEDESSSKNNKKA